MGPAPTIRLATGGAPTSPIRPGGAGGPPTIALPKATVQLQAPTQPLGTSFSSPSQIATLQSEDDEEGGNEGLLNILSIVGFAAALVVLIFQLMTASTWISAPDSDAPGDWSKLMN